MCCVTEIHNSLKPPATNKLHVLLPVLTPSCEVSSISFSHSGYDMLFCQLSLAPAVVPLCWNRDMANMKYSWFMGLRGLINMRGEARGHVLSHCLCSCTFVSVSFPGKHSSKIMMLHHTMDIFMWKPECQGVFLFKCEADHFFHQQINLCVKGKKMCI